ncbi:MAG: 5-deoxy-glucuronate isomerase [Chloroflexi bacterium]|nr:5-deoxy-glucuronate isomerase [Chloroflexota bacterium]
MDYFASVAPQAQVTSLPYNPCNLLDFQLLKLAPGDGHSGAASDREIVAVLLGGQATFDVNEQHFEHVGGRPNVFAGKPHAVYLPAGSSFTITANSAAEIALVSAPSDLQTAPYVITPAQVTSGMWGAANFSRRFNQILTATGQPGLPARRLIVGETITPSGHWSTYPAHKHEVDDLPAEAFHEEMYYFKVAPSDGFGIARFYTGADRDPAIEENYTVRDNTILMMPFGYHTYVGAPGFTSYYLWFLAGEHRTQAVIEDPDTRWVSKTVPMLRELGH